MTSKIFGPNQLRKFENNPFFFLFSSSSLKYTLFWILLEGMLKHFKKRKTTQAALKETGHHLSPAKTDL